MFLLQAQTDSATGLAYTLILLALYMIPTIIAFARKVPNTGSVLVINLLLGWTLIGWVVALAMAVRTVPPVQRVSQIPPRPDRR